MDTTEFCQRVRQATQMADSDEDWPNSQILIEATNCMYERFVQPVVTTRSGYWLQSTRFDTVPGQSAYRIPPRAIVQGLELFMTSAPNSNVNSLWSQLAILTSAQAVEYVSQPQSGVPQFFAFEGDCVVLYPTPQVAQPIVMKYYLRPAQLVEPPEYSGSIIGYGSTSSFTVDSPIGDLPWAVEDYVDIVNTTGTSETIAVDCYITSITADGPSQTVIEIEPLTVDQTSRVASFTPTTYFVNAGEIWTIPLPMELHSSLVSFVSAAILVDRGDGEKAAQLVSRCEAATKAIIDVMVPRVKTRPYVFRTQNTYLRRRAGWRPGWW